MARILVIDDDRDFRTSVRTLLKSQGHEVFEAESGKVGLQKLGECRPDLILLDVMMESKSEGYGVTQAIKFRDAYSEFSEIPIVMISSIELSPAELYAFAGELGMICPDCYVTKPIDIPKFLEVIRKFTDRVEKVPQSRQAP